MNQKTMMKYIKVTYADRKNLTCPFCAHIHKAKPMSYYGDSRGYVKVDYVMICNEEGYARNITVKVELNYTMFGPNGIKPESYICKLV